MDFALVLQFARVVFRELWERKFLALMGFSVVSFVVLLVGMNWPSKFETSATIYADNQNILGPLLKDHAEQSKLEDHAKVVKDMLHSPRMLQKVAQELYPAELAESVDALGRHIALIRSRIDVRNLASGYIKISYSDTTSHGAYRALNTIIDVFIRSSSEEQRSESREAYLFIDNQVQQYKDQLVAAEERLKNFSAQNFDGRDGDVHASISRLRSQIEELKISIDENLTTVAALENQLEDESEYSSRKAKASVYAERLGELEARLSNLLLRYTEDYPDVVSIRYQIDDIRKSMSAPGSEQDAGSRQSNTDDPILNPLYQELRSRLSQANTDIKAKRKRLSVLKGLMAQEFERSKRIAARGAEAAELNRDYSVTKRIYEDMLERKEKARLSMTLNVEGQGVTYRVQDPPIPPHTPSGLRYMHFVMMGPFAGVLLVLGLALTYVILDPRIRFSAQLEAVSAPLLAVVPHVTTPLSKRVFKKDVLICAAMGLIIMAAYLSLAFATKLGII